MTRYKGTIVFRYYQDLEVEAESEEEAKHNMVMAYDKDKADGEWEVYDLEKSK